MPNRSARRRAHCRGRAAAVVPEGGLQLALQVLSAAARFERDRGLASADGGAARAQGSRGIPPARRASDSLVRTVHAAQIYHASQSSGAAARGLRQDEAANRSRARGSVSWEEG